jgi:hypothetical protein
LEQTNRIVTVMQARCACAVERIVVTQHSALAARGRTADEACINQMAFNPANGFEPLGITHARKAVYAASAANRKDRGLLTGDEARQFIERS